MIERAKKVLTEWGLLRHELTEFERISWEPVEPRAKRSLACDVIVLSYGPDGGPYPSHVTALDWMVRAALVVELRLEGRLEVDGSDRQTTATVCDPHALGDPQLDNALRKLNTGDPKKVMKVAGYLPSARQVVDRLLEEGLLAQESSKRFGLLTTTLVRPTAAAGREELMDRLSSAWRGGSVPDERTALLVAVFNEFGGGGSFVPVGSSKETRRAGEAVVATLDEDYRALIHAVGLAEYDSKQAGDVSAT